jgi:Uma2 family endonuclease
MKNRMLPAPFRAPSTARARKPAAPSSERMLLNNISWHQYEKMVDLFAEQRLFMTYADGQLELRMPLREHERASELLNYIIAFIAHFLNIRMEAIGSTTFKSSAVEKGLEPDKCFYINNIDLMLSKRKLDLAVDPPPDLAIEIEITSSLIPRLPIYRQLGIPELWRYDGKSLTIELLQKGQYVASKASKAFPKVTSKLLMQWMKIGQAKGYSAMLRAVEGWCGKGK